MQAKVVVAMSESGSESDLESYTSMPAQGGHHRNLSAADYYDIDPRSGSRSSTDAANTSMSSTRSSTSGCFGGGGSAPGGILSNSNGGGAGPLLSSAGPASSKPHKAQDLAWEAIRAVKARDGGVGLSHFRFIQRLGSGDIGSVYLAELRGAMAASNSCFFAIKVMDKRSLAGRNKLLRAQTEREILEALDHPFLPTLYAHIDERHFSCLVMEFCPGGDLHVLRQRQSGKRFCENAVRFYAAEVLLALEYLHMMGIVYRDLKPENVLVREDGHIMLSDFDLSLKCSVNPVLSRLATVRQQGKGGSACMGAERTSSACVLPGLGGCVAPCSVHPIASCLPVPRFLGSSRKAAAAAAPALAPRRRLPELIAEPTSVRSMSFVGTHEYLAPEIIIGDGHGSAVDWWTFGIFLFELLHGKTPFKGSDNEATLMNVVTQPLRFPNGDHDHHQQLPDNNNSAGVSATPAISAAAQDLIRGLLTKDPLKRLAATRGAGEVKQHAFFEGVNWALIRCAIPPEIPSPYTPPPPTSPDHKYQADEKEDQEEEAQDLHHSHKLKQGCTHHNVLKKAWIHPANDHDAKPPVADDDHLTHDFELF